MDVDVLGARFRLEDSRIDATPEEIRRQIREYERGERRSFDLDVEYVPGFGGEVMRAMAAIPYGETRTYGELAAELNTAAVAVGQACGGTPLPVIVPCHRVVGANSLGGYSGPGGVATKHRLLSHEGAIE